MRRNADSEPQLSETLSTPTKEIPLFSLVTCITNTVCTDYCSPCVYKYLHNSFNFASWPKRPKTYLLWPFIEKRVLLCLTVSCLWLFRLNSWLLRTIKLCWWAHLLCKEGGYCLSQHFLSHRRKKVLCLGSFKIRKLYPPKPRPTHLAVKYIYKGMWSETL